MKRERIELTDSVMDVVVKMSEGNPGAVRVCAEVLKAKPGGEGLFTLLDFDDMGMRGPQLWVAYKDFCKCDVQKLIEAAHARSQEMVLVVNSECRPPEYEPCQQYGRSSE